MNINVDKVSSFKVTLEMNRDEIIYMMDAFQNVPDSQDRELYNFYETVFNTLSDILKSKG
ncbi:hypothetical protein [Erwinia phage FBB1]|nr:hypothetical protein [Erwinia phage FBB1]